MATDKTLQAFDQALQVGVGHLRHIGQCRQGFYRNPRLLRQVGQLVSGVGHREDQGSDAHAHRCDASTSDQASWSQFAQHRAEKAQPVGSSLQLELGIVRRTGQELQPG